VSDPQVIAAVIAGISLVIAALIKRRLSNSKPGLSAKTKVGPRRKISIKIKIE
jgi:hypothetical protein